MTHADAFEVVLRMFLLCGLFTPLAACAGWRDTPKAKRKNKTTRRNRTGRTARTQKVSVLNESKRGLRKAARERPLSFEDQNRLTGYFMGRDFPGFKFASNIPL